MKTTYRKSKPANFLQVLIFGHCFKVHLGYHIEKAFYLPYYCSLGFEPFCMVGLPLFLLNTRWWVKSSDLVYSLIILNPKDPRDICHTTSEVLAKLKAIW